MKSHPISFRLNLTDKQALEKAASNDARSVSSLLTLIVRQWLENKEKKQSNTRVQNHQSMKKR